MNPLKQGLKRQIKVNLQFRLAVFIHESIKTRVETHRTYPKERTMKQSLSMNPLKQGLKPL